MNETDVINIEKRINLFSENKTYTFIKLVSGQILNGYISKVDNKIIQFKDDILGGIPILIEEIEILNYSNKKGDAR